MTRNMPRPARSRKRVVLLCGVLLILGLALLIPTAIRSSGGSRYSRRVEADFFSLDMERLNCAVSEPFPLHKGDTVEIRVARVSGRISVSVGMENREPVYEGSNPPDSFRITVPEDGTYFLTVSGKQAEGRVSFRINPGREDPVRRIPDISQPIPKAILLPKDFLYADIAAQVP